ncbi:MAG: hypothetical protein K9M80_02175 [Candidatus Marinimicrobia bacterium]|nr:hypothetical protein [Candidatus Neomarinimicrobiota bacterium]
MIKLSKHYLILILLILVELSFADFGSQLLQSNPDTLDVREIYYQAYQTALLDNKIDSSEEAILKSLRISLQLSNQEVQQIIFPLKQVQGTQLDQTGRWQFVLQNTGWGGGLYGWGIPYALGADENRWLVGMEMLTLGTTFYLSHKYSGQLSMPLSRAQMLGLGSGVGLHYGFAINEIFDLNNEDHSFLEEDLEKRFWPVTLMGAVPIGMLVGDYLYDRWQPEYGRTWALSLGTMITLKSLYDLQVAFDPEPEEPGYFIEALGENVYSNWREDHDRWQIRRALLTLAAYPVGIYYSKVLTENKQYTFGDALILSQGYFSALLYNYMVLDILGVKGRAYYRLGNIAIGLLGTSLYQDIIDNYDYNFGESVLMALGTTSGMAFGLGTSIITKASHKMTNFLVLAGGITGSLLTKPMLSPKLESPSSKESTGKLSLSPTLFVETKQFSYNKIKIIPGLNVSLQL